MRTTPRYPPATSRRTPAPSFPRRGQSRERPFRGFVQSDGGRFLCTCGTALSRPQPSPPLAPGEEVEDPRAELVRRLLEYERIRAAARELDQLPLAERDFALVRIWFERVATTRLPEVRPEDLKTAWAGLVARARGNRHHLVTREQLSVRSQMIRLLKLLEPGLFVEFTALFEVDVDVPRLVVVFLAILELAREQLIDVAQAAPFAPIYVQRKGDPAFVLQGDA